MKFSLAFSPCPNDTFIFDALVNQKIDTKGISFEVFLEDVQTLNEWAMQGKMDFSKISYGVWNKVNHQYSLLNSGGALGKGVGPLLITKPGNINSVNDMTIAIPGENTTAHLLFSLAYPNATKKVFKVFHEIENAVLNGEVDAGVIIHENRFTYEEKGLVKIVDLGTYWEETQQLPIPLGGIIAKKTIDPAIIQQVDALIKQSIEYAFAHYPTVAPFVSEHAQEMSEEVMRQHINLYVNNFSLDLGDEGLQAVEKLTHN
ncbi:1,4-dihydroxy-6-naphthoate synthase [Sediminibacterium sp.]|uniref:1,4-dihydroxy-6-naphthoate synthase n=1 Tax=Sediminibacterium sp. TaxID=1917865 RepID=UPI00271C04EC|nr:1,4-dihydroxy-6-naphthoate synthase [Sediminibacterium sp.]MDO8997036.1 1,4-dihydroxy-6-naphthoate synthase [Sediminibacterium sp.]MDP1973736.1 1,4-dihydroxy-6-naphthoate synthase [Sediminibacterium sp.]MDP2421842.1 1,4-dihydroxy-6-naphthoate synthase [Sediminibacterium sp.]